VISLGDLAFRFPNLIEPWTTSIYSRLKDKDQRVRKNTLMVLAHLILNDMIKVKGQISEMAVCLEDADQRIADLAKLFFHELAQKGNAIYNILPGSSYDTVVNVVDLISSLSANPDISEASFKSIMKYQFSFIDKERQAESLVEKLCHRFIATKGAIENNVTYNLESEWRNIAYCLSLLNYNEKALKKLNELHKTYHDKLYDEDIANSFTTIISKSRKFAKPEMKEVLADLESKINNPGVTRDEDGNEIKVAQPAKKAPPSKM